MNCLHDWIEVTQPEDTGRWWYCLVCGEVTEEDPFAEKRNHGFIIVWGWNSDEFDKTDFDNGAEVSD